MIRKKGTTVAKKTKAQQKVEAEKLALRNKLLDLLNGAAGMDAESQLTEYEGAIMCVIGLDDFSRWLTAAMKCLTYDRWDKDASAVRRGLSYDEARIYRDPAAEEFHVRNLEHFDTIESAVDLLYTEGVRSEASR